MPTIEVKEGQVWHCICDERVNDHVYHLIASIEGTRVNAVAFFPEPTFRSSTMTGPQLNYVDMRLEEYEAKFELIYDP